MKNLKLSKTALRELTRLYRGVMVATLVVATVAATDANAADVTAKTGTDFSSITGASGTEVIGSVDLSAYATNADLTTAVSTKQDTLTNTNNAGNGIDIDDATGKISVESDLTVDTLKLKNAYAIDGNTAGTINMGENKLTNIKALTLTDGSGNTATLSVDSDEVIHTGSRSLDVGEGALNSETLNVGTNGNEFQVDEEGNITTKGSLTLGGKEVSNINTGASFSDTTTDSTTLATMEAVKAQAQNATYTPLTSGGNLSSTTLATAIQELDSEKAGTALDNTFTGKNTFKNANGVTISNGTKESNLNVTSDGSLMVSTGLNAGATWLDTLRIGSSSLPIEVNGIGSALTTFNDSTDDKTLATMTNIKNQAENATFTAEATNKNVATGTLNSAIDSLDAAIGSRTYTGANNIASNDTVTESLAKLDAYAGAKTKMIAGANVSDTTTDLSTAVNELDVAIGDRDYTGGSLNYTNGSGTVTEAIQTINANIGGVITGANTRTVGQVSGTATVNANIKALDEAIGSMAWDTDKNLEANTDVTTAVKALDSAIGDRDYAHARYVTRDTNVTRAISDLDQGLSNLEDRVDKYHKETKAGFASIAALSALVPNARTAGDTQISVGTGYHRGETGFALGAFHYINDNVLLNLGGAYAGDASATFRGGVTFGF